MGGSDGDSSEPNSRTPFDDEQQRFYVASVAAQLIRFITEPQVDPAIVADELLKLKRMAEAARSQSATADSSVARPAKEPSGIVVDEHLKLKRVGRVDCSDARPAQEPSGIVVDEHLKRVTESPGSEFASDSFVARPSQKAEIECLEEPNAKPEAKSSKDDQIQSSEPRETEGQKSEMKRKEQPTELVDYLSVADLLDAWTVASAKDPSVVLPIGPRLTFYHVQFAEGQQIEDVVGKVFVQGEPTCLESVAKLVGDPRFYWNSVDLGGNRSEGCFLSRQDVKRMLEVLTAACPGAAVTTGGGSSIPKLLTKPVRFFLVPEQQDVLWKKSRLNTTELVAATLSRCADPREVPLALSKETDVPVVLFEFDDGFNNVKLLSEPDAVRLLPRLNINTSDAWREGFRTRHVKNVTVHSCWVQWNAMRGRFGFSSDLDFFANFS